MLVVAAQARTVDWSGYSWQVRPVGQQEGPGPNNWSDSADNVNVAADDSLHLSLVRKAGAYDCSEIYLDNALGHGVYEFQVEGQIDALGAPGGPLFETLRSASTRHSPRLLKAAAIPTRCWACFCTATTRTRLTLSWRAGDRPASAHSTATLSCRSGEWRFSMVITFIG